ncbi:uncharacterized protein [Lolium perenne]|uniref:uncharacterized protein n=1 Tax=Lolium perenne TaxID=4522 RepID=UPI0021EB1A7A
MAAEHHRKRVLFVVDYETDGYLVFKVNLKDLFSDDHTVPPPPPTEMEVLPLPGTPVASFQEPEVVRGNIAFAVSGTTIVGLGMKRTFTYDTDSRAAQSGPTTGGFKCGALLLPVGADIYALSLYPHLGSAARARPRFEAMSPREPTVAWRALPEPPPEVQRVNPDLIGVKPVCSVTACFTMGRRLWLSLRGLGTYSLEQRTWRKEGDWEVPVEGCAAVYVPELGRLLGFCPDRRCLCACDMDARPPVVTEAWEETWPWECFDKGYGISPTGSLVYLGNGSLCITRLVDIKAGRTTTTSALCVQAVQLHTSNQGLQMVKRRIRCYTLPKYARRGYALQPTP